MALQQALASSNDPNDTRRFIHDDDEGQAFANAIRKIQRSQQCYPTVTEEMARLMCNTTLEEFCDGKTSDSYLKESQDVIKCLGYVNEDLKLALDHNVLTMVWEMNLYLPEAIHLCAVLEQLYFCFCYNKTKNFKESDATQNDFLSVLLHVVDRVPAKEGEESFQQYLRLTSSGDNSKVLNDDAIAMWTDTESSLHTQKKLIDSLKINETERQKMQLSVLPEDGLGPPLDKGVYEMIILKQKGFREDQSLKRRNELKHRIVRLGQICLIAHNNLQQPHGKYSALEVHFRRLFSNIKYSVGDMMTQLTDQEDLTEI